MYACINIYLSLHACLCVCGVCVCVCVCVHVGDKVKQERHEIAFCDIVCRPNVAVNKKTVRKRAVFHCWADARINTHKHNTTHTYIHTYISRVSLQSFSRHSRDSGCHDALQQMKTVSDERGSEQVNTERKDIATLSLTHTHTYTHIHTRTHTHTYTHARAHDTHIHTRTHLSTGMRRRGSHGAAGQYPTLTLCRDNAAVRK